MGTSAAPLKTCVGVGLLSLLTACVTSLGVGVPTGAQLPRLSLYQPPEIIVGTRNTGAFKVIGGCVLFELVRPANSRSAALFPSGSTWVNGSRAIRLPDGQLIPIGQAVEVAYEAPPGVRDTLPGCPSDSIHVLNIVTPERAAGTTDRPQMDANDPSTPTPLRGAA